MWVPDGSRRLKPTPIVKDNRFDSHRLNYDIKYKIK